MDKNKITTFIFLGVLFVVLIIACCVGGEKNNSSTSTNLSEDSEVIMNNLQTESESVKESEMGDFKDEINVDKYLELIDGNSKSFILVARPTCSYCQLVEPIIKKLIKDKDLTVYYLNTDDFSDDDTANFISSNEEWSEGFGTPMLLVVGNGKILDMVDQATDTAHYNEFFDEYK